MEAVQDLSEAVSGRVVCDLIKYYRRYEKWKNCEWRRFIIYIFSSLPPTAKPNAKELGKEIKCCKMERIDATNTKNGTGTCVVRMLHKEKYSVVKSIALSFIKRLYTERVLRKEKSRCLAKSSFAGHMLIGLVQHNSNEQVRK
jgi:hypothetical protein